MPRVRVQSVSRTGDVSIIELHPVEGSALPAFTAGAHIDVHLPSGHSRSYSLANAPDERHRYLLGVHRAPASRGGSDYIHATLCVGDVVDIDAPLNNFAFDETARHSVLIGGGIGITPLLSMLHRGRRIAASVRLIYCARSRDAAPFLPDLLPFAESVTCRFDDEHAGFLDIAALIAAEPAGTHFYCCGPEPMLQAFEHATAGLPPAQVHVERFAARQAAATEHSFELQLARSGQRFVVPAGQTILEVLTEAGFDLPSSCEQGVCGTCETVVLEGIPDHRDEVLTETERARNDRIMVCCSGSKTPRLVLDL